MMHPLPRSNICDLSLSTSRHKHSFGKTGYPQAEQRVPRRCAVPDSALALENLVRLDELDT